MIAPLSVLQEGMPMADTGEDARSEGEQPNPRARLMQEVAAQMDAIEVDFGDKYEIGRVITIVEVTGDDGNVGLRVRAGQFPWVAIGMLEFAKKSVEAQIGGQIGGGSGGE
jgi:hypothetical protein